MLLGNKEVYIMDAEKFEWIESSMEEIKKTIWEMDWEKQFGSLPKNSFQGEGIPAITPCFICLGCLPTGRTVREASPRGSWQSY